MMAEAGSDQQSETETPTTNQAENEVRWANAGENLAVLNFSEKVIEEKERHLRECIANNYTRIKDVERELSGLQMQLKLSTGPKKSALMMMRKKIEAQNERVLAARERRRAAHKVFEASDEALRTEEAVKDRLCQELNLLVQQSAHAQLEKLEQLTARLEKMNRYVGAPEEVLKSDAAAKTVMAALRRVPAQPQPAAPAATELVLESDVTARPAAPRAAAEVADDTGASAAEQSPEIPPAQAPASPPRSPDNHEAQEGSQNRQAKPSAAAGRRPAAGAASSAAGRTSPGCRERSAGPAAARARHIPLSSGDARAPSPSRRAAAKGAAPASGVFRGFDS